MKMSTYCFELNNLNLIIFFETIASLLALPCRVTSEENNSWGQCLATYRFVGWIQGIYQMDNWSATVGSLCGYCLGWSPTKVIIVYSTYPTNTLPGKWIEFNSNRFFFLQIHYHTLTELLYDLIICVCKHAYICTSTHLHTHIHIYVRKYKYTHVCTYGTLYLCTNI